MKVKILEVRDRATFIPVMAIQMFGENDAQAYYVHDRCGHTRDGSDIVVVTLGDSVATSDPYEWASRGKASRTLPEAHNYIINHFGSLSDGDVVDVQAILRETSMPKISERLLEP